MAYKDDLNTGQGAKFNNQDILGCLFLCYKSLNYDFLLIIKKNI